MGSNYSTETMENDTANKMNNQQNLNDNKDEIYEKLEKIQEPKAKQNFCKKRFYSHAFHLRQRDVKIGGLGQRHLAEGRKFSLGRVFNKTV